MKLPDILQRRIPALPWQDGEKIPWNDPAFSGRMLEVHLSQSSDWASRRNIIIHEHVKWMKQHILSGPSKVLDLGCGPGLYAQKFWEAGHRVVGIDFSPASIGYAQNNAQKANAQIDYILGDVRTTPFGSDFDLVFMVFGEFNVFKAQDARLILQKAHDALRPGGTLIIEAHTFDEVKRQGQGEPIWTANDCGLFAEYPHLLLQEHFWHSQHNVATTRYIIVDMISSQITIHAMGMQAYTNERYEQIFKTAGFENFEVVDNMATIQSDFDGKFVTLVAQKKTE